MKIHVLDRTGHTTLTLAGVDCSTDPNPQVVKDLDAEFSRLCAKGYAMFADDVKVKSLVGIRPEAEILALAPLVGG